jgi:hypothetical protein
VVVAQSVAEAIRWLSTTIAEVLGDSLSSDRKGRQKRRKEEQDGDAE